MRPLMPPKAQPFQTRPVTSWNARNGISTIWRVKGENILTSGGNLLPGSRDTDNDALTPSLVASFQSSAHDTNITSAVKCVVTSAIGHVDEFLLDTLVTQLSRVDEVSRAEFPRPGFLAVVHVNGNNLASLVLDSTLDDGQPDAPGTKDSDVGTFLHASSNHSSTVTGGDTTTQKASPVHWSFIGDSDDGDIGHNGVLREGGSSHEVKEVLSLSSEPRCAVRHDTFALRSPDLSTEVGLARFAELTFPTLRGARSVVSIPGQSLGSIQANEGIWEGGQDILESNDIVSRFNGCDTFSDRLYDTRALVTQDNGECPFGILARECIGIYKRKGFVSIPIRTLYIFS